MSAARRLYVPNLGYRRRTPEGRALHSCVVCEKLEPWSDEWKWWGSLNDVDDGEALAKFCSDKCSKHRLAVTQEMCEAARQRANE